MLPNFKTSYESYSNQYSCSTEIKIGKKINETEQNLEMTQAYGQLF